MKTLFAVLTFLGLTVPALIQPLGSPGQAGSSSPNIVVILTDDLGYGDLASWGHHTIKSPSLDRLASQGMTFTNYYAPSPLCSPSRAALLTGRTHYRIGIPSWIPEGQNIQMGPREITFATLLKERGYQTFLSGKWHLNGSLADTSHTQPQDHGFDSWLALHAFPIPHQQNPENFYRDGKPLGKVEGFTAQISVDAALDWLQKRDRESPFLLYLATIEPHTTIANPERYNAMYSQFTHGTPDPVVNGLPQPADNLEARGPGEYYANITFLDAQVGRILDYLDANGLTENTFLLFTSDNGPVTSDWRHWWEINTYGNTGGLRGRKADLYEGGIRVPAIVRYPGVVRPGTSSDVIISGYDVLPTLASIAGFDVPGDRPIDGEDFSSALRGEDFERSRPLYWEFNDDQGFHFALRDGPWKLLASENFERVELYNLDNDRFEVQDLAASNPGKLAEMRAKLETLRRSVHSDPLKP